MNKKPVKIEETKNPFNIPGLTFKPGGNITISGNAKATFIIDGKEVKLSNKEK